MTLFQDDVSMPEVNEWGDQPTLELLRQLVEYGTMAFLEKDKRGDMKQIEQLRHMAAMRSPRGANNDIPARLKRHYAVIQLASPNANEVFGPILKGVYSVKGITKKVEQIATENLASLSEKLLSKARAMFLPTPAKFHYSLA